MRESEQIQIVTHDHLETLRRCGGYYLCPKDASGKRLGPLVGYAGRYPDASGQMKQWVGDVYYNVAKAEEHPEVLEHFARWLAAKTKASLGTPPTYTLGAPMGGIALAYSIATHLGCRFAFAEKKVTALATATERERTVLNLGRHELLPYAKVAIVEDLCNNFSTTDELCELAKANGARVVCVVCVLNRSPYKEWKGLPVISLVHEVMPQYTQDDPEVAADVTAGNVVWKVKENWPRLASAMEAARSAPVKT